MANVTNDVRKTLREYLEIAGISQADLARATKKTRQQISKALLDEAKGKIGSLPSVWENMLEATGLKLVVVPNDAEVTDLIQKAALKARQGEKLREVSDHAQK